jgi:hypothetical protein
MRIRGATAGVLAVLTLGLGCGRKADPQPYALVQPEAIQGLQAEIRDGAVRLVWPRPEKYTGGRRMDDLGGFLVFRGRPGEEARQIGEVAVTDRERFQREKRFEFLDRSVEPGGRYYYRIVSYTTDGYYSDPSNQVTVELSP